MRIGHIKAIDRGFITRYRFFFDGIRDLLTVRVFSQVCKCPAIIGADRLTCSFLAVCFQNDGDLRRSDSVLVVGIRPGLRSGNSYGFRDMRIDHAIAISTVCGVIPFDRFFFDFVHDRLLRPDLIKIIKGPGPISAAIGRHGLCILQSPGTGRFIHFIQLNSDACGALAILVIIIVPCLGTGNAGLFDRMRVGHVVAVICGRVFIHRVFYD